MVRREQNVSKLQSEQEVVSLSAVQIRSFHKRSLDSVKIIDEDSYSQASDTTSCEHTVCDL